MPQYFVYVHLDGPIEEGAEVRVTELLKQNFFYKRLRPENDIDRPRTLPPWLYEGHSDNDLHELAHRLRLLVNEEVGCTPYILTMRADEFGLSYASGALIGIEYLDPSRS